MARPSLPARMYQRMRNAWVHSRIYNWPRDLFQVALFFAIWTNVALLARLGLGIWLMIMFGRFGNNYLECWDESEMSNVTVLMPIIVKDLVGEAYAFSIYGQPGKIVSESITVAIPFTMFLVFAILSVLQFNTPGSTRRATITSLFALALLAGVHLADMPLWASAWEVDDGLAVCRTSEAKRLFKEHEERLRALRARNWATWAGIVFLALYCLTAVYATYFNWKEERDSLPQSIPLQNVAPSPHSDPTATPFTVRLLDPGALLPPTPPLIAPSNSTPNCCHGPSTDGLEGERNTATDNAGIPQSVTSSEVSRLNSKSQSSSAIRPTSTRTSSIKSIPKTIGKDTIPAPTSPNSPPPYENLDLTAKKRKRAKSGSLVLRHGDGGNENLGFENTRENVKEFLRIDAFLEPGPVRTNRGI